MNRRTSLVLDASLYAELKSRAALQGRTLADIIDAALRAAIDPRSGARRPPRRLPSYDLGPFLVDPSDRAEHAGGAVAPGPRPGRP